MSFTDSEIIELWEHLFRIHRTRVDSATELYPDVQSTVFSFGEVDALDSTFAEAMASDPARFLSLGGGILSERCVMSGSAHTSDADVICSPMELRISSLPSDMKKPVRSIRNSDRGHLISVYGMVRKLTSVMSRTVSACWHCARCGHTWYTNADSKFIERPAFCPCCPPEKKSIITRVAKQDICRDYQEGEIQESPEGLSGGRQPQTIRFCVWGDQTSILKAGSKATLNGILALEDKRQTDDDSISSFILDVNYVELDDDDDSKHVFTDDDMVIIRKMGENPYIVEDLADSLAPSIYGYDDVKKSLVLQLAGGVQRMNADSSYNRGDIHTLLIGDPGTAKSQLLQIMSKIAPSSQLASGKSASAAGLTASVVKDGDKWTIEAGALVLADGGHAFVDELDKMRPDERNAMLSALEQQTITVNKAGINTTLRSKCSLLAAANPINGRFDNYTSYFDQINIEAPLLSRFDLIYLMVDKPDTERDSAICDRILDTHSGVERDAKYTHAQMSLYLAYVRSTFRPNLTDEARAILKDSYMLARSESGDGNITITARQMEACIRLATASAKLHMRDEVLKEDADLAVGLFRSYLESIRDEAGSIDIDKVFGIANRRDRELIDLIDALFDGEDLSLDDIIVMLPSYSEGDIRTAVRKMLNQDRIFRPERGVDVFRKKRRSV